MERCDPLFVKIRLEVVLFGQRKTRRKLRKTEQFFFNLVKHFIGHKSVYYLQWQPTSSSVTLNIYIPPHWGRKSGSGGRRHNWASRPLHFPCKSASHSQSFHSSSRNHAPSQPHSLTTAETIARQLRPPTTMAGGRTSSRGFADSCKMPQTPSNHPGVKLYDSSPHEKYESGGHDCRVRPPCTQVFKSRNSCSCPCLRKIE